MLDEEVAKKHTLLVYGGGARLEVTGGRTRGVEKKWALVGNGMETYRNLGSRSSKTATSGAASVG